MKASELKSRFIDFFVKKGHQVLPNVSLVPENDSSTLFISAGMQPVVPYLLGEPHPSGKRLCSLQRCLRTVDIENVGDVFHNTFFEMLGNWSLGDYWKKESLSWSLEFLTKSLGLDSARLHVTIFAGDKNAPNDEESERIWLALGIPKNRIYSLPREDNWWEAGVTGPGGPDSEIFYDLGKPKCGSACRPGDGCGRFTEMWNNVFMEYNHQADGRYEKLNQRNVDTGMGVERTSTVLQAKSEVFQTDVFWPIVQQMEKLTGQSYQKSSHSMRIVADHLRASVFLIGDGVVPANTDQGYVLRRLIRRAIRFGQEMGFRESALTRIVEPVFTIFRSEYPNLAENENIIKEILRSEEEKFSKTLTRGLREFEKMVNRKNFSGQEAFFLYESYGFPFELTQELIREKKMILREEDFKKALNEHQRKSRQGAAQKFSGGLADHSLQVTKLHTATHLLHQALRQVLGSEVHQAGSNITSERLRFDFTFPRQLTGEELFQIEKIINEQIKGNLPVKMNIMTLEEAKSAGALAFFQPKYQDKVKVFSIGNFSKEVCGGPHVSSTAKLKGVKITKEEAVGVGQRRIYAILLP